MRGAPRRTCEPWSRAMSLSRRVRRPPASAGQARRPRVALRRARLPDARHRVGHRRRPAGNGVAPAQAPGDLDAAGRPHRRRRDARGPRRGARPPRSWACESSIPARGRVSSTSTCTTQRSAIPTSTCATCCWARTATPSPRSARAPRSRWCTWDEAVAIADPALIDALALARVAYEDSRDGCPRPPARGPGPRHLHHPAPTPPSRAARDEWPRRSGGAVARAFGRGGRRRGAARCADGHPEGPRGADRRHHRAAATPSRSACTPPPAHRAAISRP